MKYLLLALGLTLTSPSVQAQDPIPIVQVQEQSLVSKVDNYNRQVLASPDSASSAYSGFINDLMQEYIVPNKQVYADLTRQMAHAQLNKQPMSAEWVLDPVRKILLDENKYLEQATIYDSTITQHFHLWKVDQLENMDVSLNGKNKNVRVVTVSHNLSDIAGMESDALMWRVNGYKDIVLKPEGMRYWVENRLYLVRNHEGDREVYVEALNKAYAPYIKDGFIEDWDSLYQDMKQAAIIHEASHFLWNMENPEFVPIINALMHSKNNLIEFSSMLVTIGDHPKEEVHLVAEKKILGLLREYLELNMDYFKPILEKDQVNEVLPYNVHNLSSQDVRNFAKWVWNEKIK